MRLEQLSIPSLALFDRNTNSLATTGLEVVLLLTIATIPVAATGPSDNPVCNTGMIPSLMNTGIQLSIWGAGGVMFLTYVGTNALESIPFISQEQREMLKSARGTAIRRGFLVFLAGPVFTLFANAADIPLASCINFVPF